MYYNDHAPPHFHAKYGNDHVTIRIDNGGILDGAMSPRALRLVGEWLELHRLELESDWTRAQAREPLAKIAPLE
jgi:hypothetical protein